MPRLRADGTTYAPRQSAAQRRIDVAWWCHQGLTDEEIAEKLDMALGTVKQYRLQAGIKRGSQTPTKKKGGLNHLEEQEFNQLWEEGVAIGMIAIHLETSAARIKRHIKRNGITRERRARKTNIQNLSAGPGLLYNREAEESFHKQIGKIPRPVTLNQRLLGDPAPGRSYLERKRDEAKETRAPAIRLARTSLDNVENGGRHLRNSGSL